MPSTSDCLASIAEILPDARVVRASFPQLVIDSAASPKEVFDAEIMLRARTGEMWEVMMTDMQDRNVIRVRLAEKRVRGSVSRMTCDHRFTEKGATCTRCGVKA